MNRQRIQFLVTLCLMLAEASCLPSAVSPDREFRGRTAQDTCIVLPEICPFEPKAMLLLLVAPCKSTDCYSYMLSPGVYEAKRQDGDGIFFEGVRKVRRPVLFGSDEVLDGGVYLRNDGKRPMAYFYNLIGLLDQRELNYCSYSVERCDLGEPPPSR